MELKLQYNPSGYREFSKLLRNKGFVENFMPKVFERDNYTCVYCGFQAKRHLCVAHTQGTYSNKVAKLSEFVTVCPLCLSCLFIGENICLPSAKNEDISGVFISLNDISQKDLNSLSHVIYCAINNGTGYESTAKEIQRAFRNESKKVNALFGEGSHHPANFINSFDAIEKFTQERLNEMVQKVHLRLLVDYKSLGSIVQDWAEDALNEINHDSENDNESAKSK